MRELLARTGAHVVTVEVPPLLAARGIRAWTLTEPDGSTAMCLDSRLTRTEAVAACRRLLASRLPEPRPALD